jgi:hypothetical protein
VRSHGAGFRCLLIGLGSRRRSASQAIDLPADGGVTLGRLITVRVPFGYWEAKDEEDDLDKEIAAKFRRGYPSASPHTVHDDMDKNLHTRTAKD